MPAHTTVPLTPHHPGSTTLRGPATELRPLREAASDDTSLDATEQSGCSPFSVTVSPKGEVPQLGRAEAADNVDRD